MALQTQSDNGSSTASSAQNTAVASTAMSTNPPPAFSLGASPPLILAFLAIGLFSLSMVVLVAWKRVRMSRGWRPPEPGVISPKSPLGERPKLWDFWSDKTVGHREMEENWDSILPLAVTTFDNATPIKQSNDTPPQSDNPLLMARSHLQQIYRYRYKRDADTKDTISAKAEIGGRLQIAVAIAMPCESRKSDETTPDYSIGIYHTPWHSDLG